MTSTKTTTAPPARSALWPAGAGVILILGAAVWLACALGADAPRAWRALLVSFIYFTPMAAGMAVWPAVARVARGQWAGPAERSAFAAVAFAPVSLAAFAGLWIGRDSWAGWTHYADLENAAWVNTPFIFAREAVALVFIWVLIAWFVRRAGRERCRRFAAWTIFAYCIVFSLVALDFVMALDPHWASALFGVYFFVSAMYAGEAAWTLASLVHRRTDTRRRHDLGKLIVAFSLLTTYMMFSQLVVIWYGNFPEEVRFVIPRLRFDRWGGVSAALLAVVYLGPLVLLLVRRSKLSAGYLAAVALAVLAGLWLERWWLVTPTLGGEMTLGLPELSITAAMAAALVLAIALFDRWAPHEAAQAEEVAAP